MRNLIKSLKNRKSLSFGFTLVELLIVIAILGVLAASVIAILDPVDKIRSGNDSKVVTDVNQLYSATGRYIANNTTGGVPANANVLTTGNFAELRSVPVSPYNGVAYVYTPNNAVVANATDVVVCGQVQSKAYAAKSGTPATCTAPNCWFTISGGKSCYLGAACTAASVCP